MWKRCVRGRGPQIELGEKKSKQLAMNIPNVGNDIFPTIKSKKTALIIN